MLLSATELSCQHWIFSRVGCQQVGHRDGMRIARQRRREHRFHGTSQSQNTIQRRCSRGISTKRPGFSLRIARGESTVPFWNEILELHVFAFCVRKRPSSPESHNSQELWPRKKRFDDVQAVWVWSKPRRPSGSPSTRPVRNFHSPGRVFAVSKLHFRRVWIPDSSPTSPAHHTVLNVSHWREIRASPGYNCQLEFGGSRLWSESLPITDSESYNSVVCARVVVEMGSHPTKRVPVQSQNCFLDQRSRKVIVRFHMNYLRVRTLSEWLLCPRGSSYWTFQLLNVAYVFTALSVWFDLTSSVATSESLLGWAKRSMSPFDRRAG